MGGDHCHNSTRARFSYSGRAISYSGRAISYSGRAISYSGHAISYSGRAVSYLGGAISLQLRNSTLGKNVLLQLRYRYDITRDCIIPLPSFRTRLRFGSREFVLLV